MLKIQRKTNGGVIFTLSGRIETEDVAELQRLFDLEGEGPRLTLDLKDVTLLDRDAVRFLARREADGIYLENCPAYIREWIERERDRKSRRKGSSAAKRSTRRRSH